MVNFKSTFKKQLQANFKSTFNWRWCLKTKLKVDLKKYFK